MNEVKYETNKTIKYSFCLAINGKKGNILLSDLGAEEKAKELWSNTEETKNLLIEDIMAKSEEVFLGLKEIKGGFMLGILIYTNEPERFSFNDISRALTEMLLAYQDGDF